MVLIPVTQEARLISTEVLGFAASEAADWFRRDDHAAVDEDFAELPAGSAPRCCQQPAARSMTLAAP